MPNPTRTWWDYEPSERQVREYREKAMQPAPPAEGTLLAALRGGQEIQFEGSTHIAMIPEDVDAAIKQAEALEAKVVKWESGTWEGRAGLLVEAANAAQKQCAAELRQIVGMPE